MLRAYPVLNEMKQIGRNTGQMKALLKRLINLIIAQTALDTGPAAGRGEGRIHPGIKNPAAPAYGL